MGKEEYTTHHEATCCLTYNALLKDGFYTTNQINRESNVSPATQIPQRENIVLLIEYCM